MNGFSKTLIGVSCFFCSSSMLLANSLENIRIWSANDETRVVIDLAEKPNFDHFVITDTKPFRLVLDLKQTKLAMPLPKKVRKSEVLTRIRESRPVEQSSFRLVFDLSKEIEPRLFQLQPAGEFGHRIVVDLPHQAQLATVQSKEEVTAKTKKDNKIEPKLEVLHPSAQKVLAALSQEKPKTEGKNQDPINEFLTSNQHSFETVLPFGHEDIVIAIDPGHGGRDPGAVGPKRKYEKHVTLAIARQIADLINSVRGMKAVLTRTGDYSVKLNARSEIARKYKAHFLISIHADGYSQPEPRGASVWVLSKNRANSEIGRWIERHEKQSELLGGGAIVQQYKDKNLKSALFDLQFSNSQKEGYNVAVEVLEELGRVTTLHKASPEYASLAVLNAPDIPSILVEAGFITNPEEETLLHTRAYQEKIAMAVYRGVKSYFERMPPDKTLFAAMKNGVKHKVKDGESLSVIAEKYRTTVEDIMRTNNLTSEMLMTSQELIIYRARLQEETSQNAGLKIRHIVQNGDYLDKIASKYGVSAEIIREYNKLISDRIDIGQILTIPGLD